MKLLFDENLSPKLAESLRKEYPESVHVRSVALRGADDSRIWEYARDHGLTIISKDNDFRQRSFRHTPNRGRQLEPLGRQAAAASAFFLSPLGWKIIPSMKRVHMPVKSRTASARVAPSEPAQQGE